MFEQYVFIDESGDPGFGEGSSEYFAIGIVSFKNVKDIEEIQIGLENFKKNMNHKKELKFSKASHDFRLLYLNEIKKYSFYSKVIVVNKKLIYSRELRKNPRLFYNFILKNILTHSDIKNANVILDGKENKNFQLELKSYLKRSSYQIKKFSLKDSKKDLLIQVADVITSAVAWGYKNENNRYRNIISEKVDIWEFK